MCKNVKKVLFALVLTLALALAFACGKPKANEENCKEFCETCPTCEKCNNASAETCKDFCPSAPECKEASAETCKKFQDFIKPTAFAVDGDVVKVGETKEVYVDEDLWEPEDCDKTLIFVSADPTIATVDADGVVTGVRPGTVTIYVTAALNDELTEEIEFEVKDAETDDQKVVNRELDAILAQLPNFVAEEYTLPQPWNTSVKVTYKVGSQEVTKLEGAETDAKVSLAITLELGDAAASYSVDIWRVSDKNINTFVVIDSAAALLENYFAQFEGEKVAADLALLSNVFGCAVKWTSSNANALATDGKYTAQAEDKAVTLDALLTYGTGSRNVSFNVTAKGYTATEKADLIMSHTFAKVEGKEFNTSIVLPEYDDLFGAKLTYKSLDDTVYGDDGKLIAAVTEKKDVKFKVTIDYSIAAKAEDNFKVEKELTIKAVPANAASEFLEAALATDAFKKYQKVVHAPWGETEGNIVFPALEGMNWKVAEVTLDARLQDGYQVFSQTANGLKLEAQYLRYQLVSIEGTYTKDDTQARIVLFFNIGISETPMNIISAIWRSSAQKDQTLSEIQGKYDLAGNVSFFDKKIGYVTETYGSGYFSGWSVTTPQKLVLSKKAGATDPDWKCAVGELALTAADYTGITKLVATVKGTADEQILLKVNDQNAGEKWVTLDGTTQEIEFVLPENFAFDATKFPLVIFCNPGKDGTGNKVEISKLQFQGTDKTIDLLKADWRSLDAGVYNVTNTVWQTFMMEVMTVYIREDAEGKAYIDPANVNGGLAGAGGNWGVWYVNTTNQEINIEVGVYNDTTLAYKEGHATTTAIGSRLNIAMDGYALGFVADSTGKIIHGSNNSKLENGMSDRRAVMGGKAYKVGDKVSELMYNAMQVEDKANKFEVVYTASDNLLFVASETGTFKKVTADDGAVSYVALAEGETLPEGESKYAPTYAKNAVLTAAQYAELDADTKKLVTVEYKATVAFTYEIPNLFGDSGNGTVVNYLTIPANGYAMSWKYQFYGVGVPATVYPFCQTGETLVIKQYQVHPLSSMDAEYANNNLDAAVDLAMNAEEPDKFDHVAFETYVSNARKYYEKLSGDTKADALDEAFLESAEEYTAMLIDGDITALLASEPAADADRKQFAKDLATMWARLYKTVEDEVVYKLTDEIIDGLTKKAAFDAKYAEYAAIDLTITYDYNGGYIQGFWKDTDKALFLETVFMPKLYAFMVEKGAWEGATAPTEEEFCTTTYWSENYAVYADTLLGQYLFTPKVDGETVNENYHDVIEGSDKFFNTPEGHKFIALMDYVDESTRSNNMSTQDAWGRNGEQYAAMEWLPKQSYYSTLAESEQTKDLTTWGGNPVIIANSGTLLGAYRFAQWVCGVGHNSYKNWMPNNQWSNLFDRQYTQDHSKQIYHCTDLTVTLQDAPYKEGFKFLGWKFEDGTDAVITGSMFDDVTVYAAWAPALEESIEDALKLQLTGVFGGVTKDARYTADNTAAGTIVDQVNTMGLGDYAFIVGDKLFVIGKYAAIELGANATEDITPDKAALQPYGIDNDTNNSTAIVNTADGPKNGDSYGYGALYHNAGEHNVIISDIVNTYGRTISGAAYGYNRYLFHYNAEKKAYVGTLLVDAEGKANVAGISVTLEPGDFLWCPMTAERYCTGLTDRDNAVIGVLKDGVEVQIVSTKDYLPVESPEWYTVEFFGTDGKLIKAFYPESGDTITFKTLDFVKNMIVKEDKPYKLLGWATTADATEATIAKTVGELTPTADAKYYPVYQEVEAQDTVTLGEAIAVLDGDKVDNLADAVALVKANGTINVPAGTYKAAFTINKPVTILGPNAEKAGTAADRAAEATISGQINVNADNVTIKGINVNGGSAKIYIGSVSNLLIENNLFDGGTPVNVIHADFGYEVTDLTIKNNKFNWAKYSYGFRPIRVSAKVTNFEFSNNYLSNDHTASSKAATLIDYFYIEKAAGTFKINDNNFACVPSTNWLMNIRNMAECTLVEYKNNTAAGMTDSTNASGINLMLGAISAEATVEISGNTFANMSGTVINLGAPTAAVSVTISNNIYRCAFKLGNAGSAAITYSGNTYYETPATTPSDFTEVAND